MITMVKLTFIVCLICACLCFNLTFDEFLNSVPQKFLSTHLGSDSSHQHMILQKITDLFKNISIATHPWTALKWKKQWSCGKIHKLQKKLDFNKDHNGNDLYTSVIPCITQWIIDIFYLQKVSLKFISLWMMILPMQHVKSSNMVLDIGKGMQLEMLVR